MKRLWLFSLFILVQGFCFSQNRIVDSLNNVLKKTKEDSSKVKVLNSLSYTLCHINPDTSITLCREALKLAEKLNWKKGMAVCFSHLGAFYTSLGNYNLSIENCNKAVILFDELGDQKDKSWPFGILGIAYDSQGNYSRALNYYFKALKIDEETRNRSRVARHLGNIGIVYDSQGDYKKALDYYFKALKIQEELGDKSGISINLSNIGLVYFNQRNYRDALYYYTKALEIKVELEDKYGIAINLSNIGDVYAEQGDSVMAKGYVKDAGFIYSRALNHYFKAIEMEEEIGDKNGVASSMKNVGFIYYHQKKYIESEQYFLKALKISEVIGALNIQKENHQYLSELYSKLKESKLALMHYKKFISIKDSINNEENTKKLVRTEMNYEFDKKEAATKLEQDKKEAVAFAESKKQRIIIWSVCGILLLVVGFAIFAYRSYLQKQRANIEIILQKEVIEEKQKEILDSIHYAKRIQTALLTSEKYIERNLDKLNP
jgi:tetratricopeptide (TPR) repeat protein